jgi:hypothetical protein
MPVSATVLASSAAAGALPIRRATLERLHAQERSTAALRLILAFD